MSGRGQLSPLFTWRSAIVDSGLPPTTRHVLLTLSLHMNERGGSCFPAHDTLAEETGLNRATVIRHIQSAEEAGWLTVARTNGRKSNTYSATVPTVAENDGSPESNRRPVSAQPSSSARQPSFSVTPTVAQGDPSTSRGRQEDAIEDVPSPNGADAEDARTSVPSLLNEVPRGSDDATGTEPSARAKRGRGPAMGEEARRVTSAGWDARIARGTPAPAVTGSGSPFVALATIVQRLLDAGYQAASIEAGIVANDGAWTQNALLEAMRRARGPARSAGREANAAARARVSSAMADGVDLLALGGGS